MTEPLHAARQAGADIEVTEEMIEAGARVLWRAEDLPPSEDCMPRIIAEVYRTMEKARLQSEIEAPKPPFGRL